jgi:hypothetical protein
MAQQESRGRVNTTLNAVSRCHDGGVALHTAEVDASVQNRLPIAQKEAGIEYLGYFKVEDRAATVGMSVML